MYSNKTAKTKDLMEQWTIPSFGAFFLNTNNFYLFSIAPCHNFMADQFAVQICVAPLANRYDCYCLPVTTTSHSQRLNKRHDITHDTCKHVRTADANATANMLTCYNASSALSHSTEQIRHVFNKGLHQIERKVSSGFYSVSVAKSFQTLALTHI